MAKPEPYPTDVTDAEWKAIRGLLLGKGKLGRPPRYERRLMLNAIFYITKSGCAWRELPHDFPQWRLVYYYYAKWQQAGVWQRLHDTLRDRVRPASGKKSPHGRVPR